MHELRRDTRHRRLTNVDEQQPALTDHVRKALRQRVDISVTPVERIERSAGGKYENCICLVGAP